MGLILQLVVLEELVELQLVSVVVVAVVR